MAELAPLPFPDLLRRMRREVELSGAIFDLPIRKWYKPGKLDLSVTHFGRRASTPVGPAAGPHTQLAQNIVLAWLAGSRILELKTVQINDRLTIPRPCIHVPNIGLNVEWSQELLVSDSLLEYAKACYLIEILKATRAFGAFADTAEFEDAGDTIYDISIGYDLEGIRSEKVAGFLRGMREPAALFDHLRAQLTGDLTAFRAIELPASISNCVTLSTFHGCPADQIEAIACHLIEEQGLHTIIKLNPTLLGYEAVRELLIDRLGYEHLELRKDAFEHDLEYEDGIEILRRLRPVAENHGTTIGAKFTNTLVIANDPEIFPTQADPFMYLSGPPLHVISMTLMQRFREDVGFELPISFSAGINARNFAAAVACGMVPVTTCTDLLRQGGYGRLPAYLRALERAMQELNVSSREAYVLAVHGHGGVAIEAACGDDPGTTEWWKLEGEGLQRVAREQPDQLPASVRTAAKAAGLDGEGLLLRATRIAGTLNGAAIVPLLANDRVYHATRNAKEPRRIDSQLALYDCINCDLCITACPNDAIFAYDVTPVDIATQRLTAGDDGSIIRSAGSGFVVRETHQLAVFEAGCNECSNCEVYCPEQGAPFVLKERLFLSPAALIAADQDGFAEEGGTLHARLNGIVMRFKPEFAANRATVSSDTFRLEMTLEPFEVTRGHLTGTFGELDTAVLWRMKTVWESIFRSDRPNMLLPEPAP